MGILNLNVKISYKTTECITCGTVIAIPRELYNQFLGNGKSFYCPLGHSQQFIQGQTEEAILRKKLEIANRGKEFAEQQAQYERNCARAQKAAKTRLKNRIKHGVCPCCNRTFKQLASHIKNKHPEYAGEK